MENTIDKREYDNIYQELWYWFGKYNGNNKLSLVSKMSLVSSSIKKYMPDFNFVGFYVVAPLLDKEAKPLEESVLEIGPFCSDHLPCCRIKYGKGVCGSTWQDKKIHTVNDVKCLENYIACDSDTKSEIVLPVFKSKDNKEDVVAVLDIDSTVLNRFDKEDEEWLQKILELIY